MPQVGDIIRIFAPTAGKKKYHLCVCVGVDGSASQFLFLNSTPGFADEFVVECERVPCLPKSTTGKTVFSLSLIVRYNDQKLELFQAKKMGELEAGLAKELLAYLPSVDALTNPEKAVVRAALKKIAGV